MPLEDPLYPARYQPGHAIYKKRASGMMYSKHNDHSLVLNKSGNTMIIRLKVMFELSLDLHG